MADELTPMQRQYLALKREVPPGAILMFRLGDFYEMFGEDAVVASPILGATLTHRGNQPRSLRRGSSAAKSRASSPRVPSLKTGFSTRRLTTTPPQSTALGSRS